MFIDSKPCIRSVNPEWFMWDLEMIMVDMCLQICLSIWFGAPRNSSWGRLFVQICHSDPFWCWENYDKPADGFAVLHNVQRNPCPNIEKPMVGNYIHMFSNIGHFPMSFWRLSMGTRLRRSQGRCCPPRCEDQPWGKVLRTWLRLTHGDGKCKLGPPIALL